MIAIPFQLTLNISLDSIKHSQPLPHRNPKSNNPPHQPNNPPPPKKPLQDQLTHPSPLPPSPQSPLSHRPPPPEPPLPAVSVAARLGLLRGLYRLSRSCRVVRGWRRRGLELVLWRQVADFMMRNL